MTSSWFEHPFLPPEVELHEQFVLAGGPGGQHVNRTESAVQLRFNVIDSPGLSAEVKQRLLQLAGHRADARGVITIEARSHRSQYRNREEARKRLAELIERAHRRPKRRIPTKPSKGVKRRRLEGKRHRGSIKQARKPPTGD